MKAETQFLGAPLVLLDSKEAVKVHHMLHKWQQKQLVKLQLITV